MKHTSAHQPGNWPSPISAEVATSASSQIHELTRFETELWWLERDPDKAGQVDIKRFADGKLSHRLPPALSCRSRVHEYGGGSYCVTAHGVYFVNDQDQEIYYLSHDDRLRCITSTPGARYADLLYDSTRDGLICVLEQHSDSHSAKNSLIFLDLSDGHWQTLAAGNDFYASPSLSPDGSQLAWLCWNHPNMPWDGSELWLTELSATAEVISAQRIAGADSVSVFQPSWSDDQHLYWVDDRSGWWNLYRYADQQSYPLYPSDLEFGLPQWIFGQRSYSLIDNEHMLCSFYENGEQQLGLFDIHQKQLELITTPYNSISCITAAGKTAYFIAASATESARVVELDLESRQLLPVSKLPPAIVDPDYYSRPETIAFTTRHGDTAYAFYYPAHNPDVTLDANTQPPLIVITHGGPTSRSDAALDLRKQYWTSRGYALLDVNYSGSTGYGRAYRERLTGNWGIRDAEDCCDAALHLVAAGLVDATRLIIKGSSAGGYSVLCALTFHDVFAAGASYYGIGELEALAKHTHKFEAHYLDHLIGPYPEQRDLYQQRSPINYVSQLNCPVIFFQGEDDKVVPKEQAEMMFAALKQKGVATSYLAFTGEAHGFRKAQTQIACLNAELEFYLRALNIDQSADTEHKLQIENLND